ncbi:MAG: alpha/beta fold hydrolase [Chloroflexi bacterium]|nr:alpha/beta fold hydrolase [Chloroflexota bacterium]
MRRFILRAVLPLSLLVVGAYFAVGWVMVSQAVAAERQPVETTPAAVGLAFDGVAFQPRGASSPELLGWWIPIDGSADAESALVLVHGVDSNRARDGEDYLELVRGLHDRGFGLLLFDLRAHGQSGGDVVSAGVFERWDVLGALDYVTAVEGVPWEQVGVLGFSMGAASALLAAEQEPRIRAVVADSSFADVSDLVAGEVAKRTPLSSGVAAYLRPGMEILARLRYAIDLSVAKPVRAIEALDYPVLLIHSEQDERFPAEYALRLREAAADARSELWLSPTGEHSRVYKLDVGAYMDRVATYFEGRFASTP